MKPSPPIIMLQWNITAFLVELQRWLVSAEHERYLACFLGCGSQ
jgi:hypothetical protein